MKTLFSPALRRPRLLLAVSLFTLAMPSATLAQPPLHQIIDQDGDPRNPQRFAGKLQDFFWRKVMKKQGAGN